MEEKPWNNYWKLISDITGHQNKLLESHDGYFNTWSFGNLQVPFNSERTLKLRLTLKRLLINELHRNLKS